MKFLDKHKRIKRLWLILSVIFIVALLSSICWAGRWKYIVIHHTAGNYGNIKHLQDIHGQRQSKEPIRAISYHYIIGNGNGMADGEIASDIRKKYNLWGVHVSGNNPDKNFRGLGIAIIGNLDKKEMTDKQYNSLLELTAKLMHKYNIKPKNIHFHGKIPGESTKCPGRFFPYKKFKQDIKQLSYNN